MKARFATPQTLDQLELFQQQGLGNFRDLMVAVAQDPAMLTFLDAGVNVKGGANENFAREIMEMFTMGVGHYTEKDIREAARAFTGWNYVDLKFVVNKDQHDDGEKTFLGRTGQFDGVNVIDIIMQQPITAEYIAGKIYRYFVREDLSPELQKQLGSVLRDHDYQIAPLMETIFLSRDFYSPASVGTHIKSPVELAVSTYHKLGLASVPGVPDFNVATGTLGQRLFAPPTVAGWAGGTELDHAGAAAGARQFRPRHFVPGHQFSSAGPLQSGIPKCDEWRRGSVRAWISRQPPSLRKKPGIWRNPTWRPIATRISTRVMAVFGAGSWRSSA